MKYSWICTSHTMHCTGPGAWTSWRGVVWVPGPSASSAGIGSSFICWRRMEGNTENPSVERGVTQGNPLPPTTFNVVMDTVVRHLESLVVEP